MISPLLWTDFRIQELLTLWASSERLDGPWNHLLCTTFKKQPKYWRMTCLKTSLYSLWCLQRHVVWCFVPLILHIICMWLCLLRITNCKEWLHYLVISRIYTATNSNWSGIWRHYSLPINLNKERKKERVFCHIWLSRIYTPKAGSSLFPRWSPGVIYAGVLLPRQLLVIVPS